MVFAAIAAFLITTGHDAPQQREPILFYLAAGWVILLQALTFPRAGAPEAESDTFRID